MPEPRVPNKPIDEMTFKEFLKIYYKDMDVHSPFIDMLGDPGQIISMHRSGHTLFRGGLKINQMIHVLKSISEGKDVSILCLTKEHAKKIFNEYVEFFEHVKGLNKGK